MPINEGNCDVFFILFICAASVITASILILFLIPFWKLVTAEARSCTVADLGIDFLKLSDVNTRLLGTSSDASLNLILVFIISKNVLNGLIDFVIPLTSF